MLKEQGPIKREALPLPLRGFLARARANTYASDGSPESNPLIPGSKELRYEEDNNFMRYHDRYFDVLERPGNFAGVELVTAQRYDGSEHLMVYSYGGGLTSDGLELGEGSVYGSLQEFLKAESGRARMGESFKVQSGEWEYENDGEVTDWGWKDRELLRKNGVLVHEVNAQGICLIKGF